MAARTEASAAYPSAPDIPGRLVTANNSHIQPASSGEVLALANLSPAQRRRHRHSPVSQNGLGGPADFSLNGERYSLDGIGTAHLGVAFRDTALGGFPHGLPIPRTDNAAEVVIPPADRREKVKHRLSAEQATAKLYSYIDKPQARYDLKQDWSIQVLKDGIKDFTGYNKHRQPENDYSEAGNGAIGFGDDKEYRVPNHNRYPLLFPHDTRVMSLPDAFTPEGRELTESALDKMVHLYSEYGIIPNYNAQSGLNVPARPVFLSTAFEWYMTHPEKDSKHVKAKFKDYMIVGAAEHEHIWNNQRDLTGAMGTSHAMVPGYTWLRKAGDMDTGNNAYNASRVIGWDESTTRFGGREDMYLPVCINAQLYRNKLILAFASEELGMPLRGRDAEGWRQTAKEMREEMYAQQFDPARGIHVDRDFEYNERSPIVTLASAWTLLAGLPIGKEALFNNRSVIIS